MIRITPVSYDLIADEFGYSVNDVYQHPSIEVTEKQLDSVPALMRLAKKTFRFLPNVHLELFDADTSTILFNFSKSTIPAEYRGSPACEFRIERVES